MTEDVRLYIALGALVLLVASGLISLTLVVRYVGRIEATLRRLHLQQANIVGMLLKAGFRPPRSRYWFDSALATRRMDDIAFTRFYWKDPNGDVHD